jgi:aminopeptidase-like protein
VLTPQSLKVAAISAALAADNLGKVIFDRAADIFPLCRSIIGPGVRETLQQLGQTIPLTVKSIPSGTKLYDWTVPDEWTFRDAYIADMAGNRLIDARNNNLHIMSYSTPVNAIVTRNELANSIHTLPEQPDLIPYRTSYYVRAWGFCLSQNQWDKLPSGPYRVVIDTTLAPGHLTYGEFIHPGDTSEEIILSAHICHPSLANDNCSGLAVLTTLAERMHNLRTRHTYRFIFAPGTIGALAWLSQNDENIDRVKAGLVVSCVGDGGGPNYKRSRHDTRLPDTVSSSQY